VVPQADRAQVEGLGPDRIPAVDMTIDAAKDRRAGVAFHPEQRRWLAAIGIDHQIGNAAEPVREGRPVECLGRSEGDAADRELPGGEPHGKIGPAHPGHLWHDTSCRTFVPPLGIVPRRVNVSKGRCVAAGCPV